MLGDWDKRYCFGVAYEAGVTTRVLAVGSRNDSS